MEQIYKPLLLFIALTFGFILLLYSEFLRLHDKKKTERIIIGILGIVLILFFLFQGDFLKHCWESTFNIQFDSGEHTLSDWKIKAMNTPYWVYVTGTCMFIVMSALFPLYFIKNFLPKFRNDLKDVEIFDLNVFFLFGIVYSIVFLFIFFIFYQFGDMVIGLYFRLFY